MLLVSHCPNSNWAYDSQKSTRQRSGTSAVVTKSLSHDSTGQTLHLLSQPMHTYAWLQRCLLCLGLVTQRSGHLDSFLPEFACFAGKVRCPVMHACFDSFVTTTTKLIEFPDLHLKDARVETSLAGLRLVKNSGFSVHKISDQFPLLSTLCCQLSVLLTLRRLT